MLAEISGEIIAWEADPSDRARLDSIFRFVHTVKGSCGFLDLPRLERLSHAAEEALAEVRSGNRQPDVQLVNSVLARSAAPPSELPSLMPILYAVLLLTQNKSI